jgi:adenosylhomocysteine nucleosidase
LPGVFVTISGMGPKRAAQATEALLGHGCRAIVSFGYCGALDPGLVPGRLVVPERLVDAASGTIVETDPLWRHALTSRLASCSLESRVRTIIGSSHVLNTEEKKSWGAQWPASVVDMESHAAATVASRCGARFAVLRVVLDRRDDELPSSLTELFDPWGRWDAPFARRIKNVLATSPRRLLVLAQSRRRAFRTLRTTARRLAPDFAAADIPA